MATEREVRSYNVDSAPTLAMFHRDSSFVRGVLGPVGAGKSTACTIELFHRALWQKPSPDGMRRFRALVVRNTYRELMDTTIATCREWFPSDGEWRMQDMTYAFRTDTLDFEVLFRSLDRAEDVRKLLSLEVTAVWFNEAREIPLEVVRMAQARVGRYPSKRHGGATWSGIIMDSNPPDTDSWWYRLFEEEKPEGWRLFKQPSGDGPHAENLPNLPRHYYKRMMAGQSEDWVSVYVRGKYGTSLDGKPVHPSFNRRLHVVSEGIRHLPRTSLFIGCDWGLTPAAVIAQIHPASGRLEVLREFVTDDMGASRFATELLTFIRKDFPGHSVTGWGDPAGMQRSQVDEAVIFERVQQAGLDVQPAPTNDFIVRKEAVDSLLTRLASDGKPAIMIDWRCKTLVRGLAGKYHFKRMALPGEARYRDVPEKNHASHVTEALQYLATGLGFGPSAPETDYYDAHRPKVHTQIRCSIRV